MTSINKSDIIRKKLEGLKFMFNNVGSKIKTLALVFTIIGFVASGVLGVIMMFTQLFVGLGFLIGGALSSWLSGCLFYALGEIVESLRNIEYLTRANGQHLFEIKSKLNGQNTNRAQPNQEQNSANSSIFKNFATKKAKEEEIKRINDLYINGEINKEEYLSALDELNNRY